MWLIALLLCIFLALPCAGSGATYTVPVFTDLHYHSVNYASRLATLTGIVSAFPSADLFWGLGDLIDDNSGSAQFQTHAANVLAEFSGHTFRWTLGNHDIQGVDLAAFLQYASAASPVQNWTYDLGNWRIISIDASSGPTFSADATTLAWLPAALDEARQAGKYIIIGSHPAVFQNYPGSPAIYTMNPYSFFALNAATIRGIIETAKNNGADIKTVVCGHGHTNWKTSVNGIKYIEFEDAYTAGAYAVLTLNDDGSMSITGYAGGRSYSMLDETTETVKRIGADYLGAYYPVQAFPADTIRTVFDGAMYRVWVKGQEAIAPQ